MKNKGFSLVELIVVIAIMAILVGVAVPVYTSYIGKANAAKDEQLLSEINSAFMVAAVDNQIDFSKLDSSNNKIEIDENGVVTFDLYNDDLNDAVAAILSGELKFNVIEDVFYNKYTRQFEDGSVRPYDYNGKTLYLSGEDIANLKNSTFGSMGMEVLMGKVDFATQLVADPDILYVDPDADELEYSTLGNLVMDPANLDQLSIYLGCGSMDDPDFNEAEFTARYEALVERKAALIANGGEITDAIKDQANFEIMANNTVLIAATKSNFDTDEFVSVLGSDDGGIKALLKQGATEDAQTALAQSAMAYAMYTAYTSKNNIPVSNDPSDVLNTLENDPNFKLYMQDPNTQADIEGYLSAMNMINDCTSSGNEAAVSDLLVNGFTDEALVELLNKATED